MSGPSCPRCQGRFFAQVSLNPVGSSGSVPVVYCTGANCGAILGTVGHDTGMQLAGIANRLQSIETALAALKAGR